MKKQPSYVTKTGSDGRRYFSRAFADGLVADLNSGNTTVAKAAKDFGISTSLIARWRQRAEGYVRGNAARPKRQNRKALAVATADDGTTLLERAVQASAGVRGTSDAVGDAIDQQVELAKAFLSGKVNEVQVRYALNRKSGKFMVTNWLGHVFAGAVRSGWRLER